MSGAALPPEEWLRVQVYGLLAELLQEPATQKTLDMIACLEGDSSPIGRSVRVLAQAAQRMTEADVAFEHEQLFGTTETAEVPATATLFSATPPADFPPKERLLAELARINALHLAVDAALPVDHAAVMCRMMSTLIAGDCGVQLDVAQQQRFFTVHMGWWLPDFFKRLEAARAAAFYMPIGTIGRRFMSIEQHAFSLAA